MLSITICMLVLSARKGQQAEPLIALQGLGMMGVGGWPRMGATFFTLNTARYLPMASFR